MSALATATSLFDLLGGESTLDDVIVSAWEGLAARQVVVCPVCDGELAPVLDERSQPAGGCCCNCGTTLS